MFQHSSIALLTIAISVAAVSPITAQLVQQPIPQTFGTATTVSIPDRGRIVLGRLGQSASGRSTGGFGPLRSPAGVGQSRAGSSMSMNVTIHDFQAMDEQLLANQPTQILRPYNRSEPAAHAYRQLTETNSHRQRMGRIASDRGGAISLASPQSNHQAERFWRLGQAAEAKGQSGVARLHYRSAAKFGSSLAAARLADEALSR